MKHLQNTLYIMTPDSYLFWENECIAVKVGGEEKVRVPAHTISSIYCFGNTTVSTPLIRFCGERGIGLVYLSESGRFYGRIQGPVSGNILLRQRQFLTSADPWYTTRMASRFLTGKLLNEKNMLMRRARESTDSSAASALRETAGRIAELSQELCQPAGLESLRGIEGAAATLYFSCFDLMLKARDPELRFEVRSRRPPENEVNALLSFLYILLKNDIQSALESVGLDPACGYLHVLRPGRPALALDLMEELRAPLCDRLAIALLNKGQLRKKDFTGALGEYRLTDQARKTVLNAWQSRKREKIMHPFLKEQVEIGLIPFVQAKMLSRCLRGDLDDYPPFVWR